MQGRLLYRTRWEAAFATLGVALTVLFFALCRVGVCASYQALLVLPAYLAAFLAAAAMIKQSRFGFFCAIASGVPVPLFRVAMETFARSHTFNDWAMIIAVQVTVVAFVLFLSALHQRHWQIPKVCFVLFAFTAASLLNCPLLQFALQEPVHAREVASIPGTLPFLMTSESRPTEILAHGPGREVVTFNLPDRGIKRWDAAFERVLGFGGSPGFFALLAGDNPLINDNRELLLQRGNAEVISQLTVSPGLISSQLSNAMSDNFQWLALCQGKFIRLSDWSSVAIDDELLDSIKFCHWVTGREMAVMLNTATDELLLVNPVSGSIVRHEFGLKVFAEGVSVSPSLKHAAAFAANGTELVLVDLLLKSCQRLKISRRDAPRLYGTCPTWIEDTQLAYIGSKHSVFAYHIKSRKTHLVTPPGQVVASLTYSAASGGPVWATEHGGRTRLYSLN